MGIPVRRGIRVVDQNPEKLAVPDRGELAEVVGEIDDISNLSEVDLHLVQECKDDLEKLRRVFTRIIRTKCLLRAEAKDLRVYQE